MGLIDTVYAPPRAKSPWRVEELYAPAASRFYGFARREWNGERTLLYVGQTDVIAVDAAPGGQLWTQALGLGMNELHVCLCPGERIDRQQLQDRIVRRLQPILNLIGRDAPPLRKASA